jgi:D-alanine-D-alanine ligase
MNIGITYDLRDAYLAEGYTEEETAEFDRTDTIEAIEGALRDLGHATDRIGHIRNLAARLVSGARWDLVFNIAEGLKGYGREAQVPALLDAYAIPYTFSDPLVLSLTLHKGITKRVIRDLGIPTPDFAEVKRASDIAGVTLPFPVFAKPVAEGTGKGISGASKVWTRSELESVCRRLLQTYRQPVIVETFLPGRELTVGVVGTGSEAVAIGVMEVMLNGEAEPEVYSYHNKHNYESCVEYRLATDPVAQAAKQVAWRAWKGLGCADAGRVDVRVDAQGVPNFLEVNPLAGLHPIHSDLPILAGMTGISYRELIAMIISGAVRRQGLA